MKIFGATFSILSISFVALSASPHASAESANGGISTLIQRIIKIARQFEATSGPHSIRVTYPAPRIVYQQDSQKQGRVLVQGVSNGNPNRAFVRLEPRAPGSNTTTTWTEIPIDAQTGKFQSSVTANAGWYDFKIVTFRDSELQSAATVQRVGVGEVFLIAGQSNAYGAYSANHVAKDDRVSVLNVDAGGAIDTANLPLNFAQAGPGTITGPKGHLFVWAEMADDLVKRLGVPVLLFNVAHPGTSTQDWVRTKNGEQNVVFGAAHPNAPYYHMRIVLQNYIRRLGIRSILWHQGEYDGGVYTTTPTGNPADRVTPGTPTSGQPADLYRLVKPTTANEYASRLGEIVRASRSDAGYSRLAWVIARASYMPYKPPHFYGNGYAPSVIQGQNQIIADKTLGDLFAGPNTDEIVSPYENARPDGCHFGESVYSLVAKKWSDHLSALFFAQSAPWVPNAAANTRTDLWIGLDGNSPSIEHAAWSQVSDPERDDKLWGYSTIVQTLDTPPKADDTPHFIATIGPVPVTQQTATIWVQSESSTSGREIRFQVVDLYGRELIRDTAMTSGSLTEIPVDLSRVSSGTYLLLIELDRVIQKKKFVVINGT